MSIIGPSVYASTIEPIWESDEAKILYQFLFYLRLILFGGCCNPFIFLIRLDLYHIHHDVIYRVEMCVCPFWIRPIYHVVHYCTRFSFFFFFFFFTIFYFLSVWVWLLELIRYSESVFFFFRLCASSAELVVEKNLFLPSSGCCSLSLFGRPLCQRRERASQAKMAGQMTTGRGRLERARCVLKTRKWSQLCCVNFFVERPDEKGQKSRSVHLAIAQHTHTDPAGSIY
jgi:glycosyltransferase involved in cell wall biosynthesis